MLRMFWLVALGEVFKLSQRAADSTHAHGQLANTVENLESTTADLRTRLVYAGQELGAGDASEPWARCQTNVKLVSQFEGF